MKKLIAIVLLLALPAVAFAEGSISLLSGGNSSIEVALSALPTTITLDIAISTPDPMSNLSAGLDGSSLITVTGVSLGSPQSGWTRWDTQGSAPTALLNSNLSQNADFGAYTTGSNVVVTDWASLTLTLDGSMVAGDYPIGVVNSRPYGDGLSGHGFWTANGDPYYGDMQDWDVSGFTLTITPEPATMLLLAGALPFLRRRTA